MTATGLPAATVLVVTYRGRALLPASLHAVQAQDYPGEMRLLVVDNASTDGTAELLARDFPAVSVVRAPRNRGFAGGNNLGLKHVTTPVVALLNDDARPRPDWLANLTRTLMVDDSVAAVTAKILLAEDGGRTVNNAGGVVWTDGYGGDRGLGDPDDGRWDEPEEVFAFCGAAVALRMAAVRATGGFDEDFFLYYEDTDLSWRLRARGWSIRYEPTAVVDHLHSATTDQRSAAFTFYNDRNRLLMLTKNASGWRAVRALLRYLLTTVSIMARGVRGGRVDTTRLFLRLRVIASIVRLLPLMLRRRRAEARCAVLPRTELERWLARR